jgi:glutathionyl-hydroquinone reductase
MGVLIEGRWTDGELSQQTIRSGACELSRQLCSATPSRPTARPASRRSRDANVHLAHGCPWWHRILIYRALKKLAKSSPSPTPYRVSSRNDPIRSVRAEPAVVFRNAITADGSPGFKAEPGR